MKAVVRALFALAALCVCAASQGGDVAASVSPQPVMAGEAAELHVSFEGDAFPEIDKLPEVPGISWLRGVSRSSSSQIVNMKRSSVSKSVYSFVADKPGSYTIPGIHVRAGKMKMITSPVAFEVVEPKFKGQGGGPGDGEQLFLKFEILSSKGSLYVGEEIPAEVRVYQQEGLRTQLSWPEIEFGPSANIVFKDFRAVNQENDKFDRYRQFRETVNGRRYEVFSFRTAFRSISPGPLKPSVSMRASVVVPDSRGRGNGGFDSDFLFGDMLSRGRTVEKLLRAAAQPLEVLSLPEPPKDSQFLGLVGDWRSEISLSEGPCRVGEPMTLRVKAAGSGTLESLKAPQLELPGFRVYPPEIDRAQGSAEIRYVLIPSEEGDCELSLSVSTFDPASGSYKPVSFAKRLKVAKANGLSSSSVSQGQVVMGGVQGEQAKTQGEPAKEGRKTPSGVLYLKRGIDRGVELPLWRNAVVPCSALLVLGLLAWAALWSVHSRRAALDADPRLLRRAAARSRKSRILKAVKAAKPDELGDLAASEIVPYLNDLLDTPPGSGAGELSGKLRDSDPELSECLERISGSSWAPGLKSSFDEAFKERLLKSLAKLSLAFVCALLPLAAGAAAPLAAVKSAPSSVEEALTAYDAGDFQAAAAFFKSKVDPAHPSPAALYDLGNCLYQMGELPKAMVCYERAMRLAPRDSDILENLNLVRRKLSLPELYRMDSPSSVLPCLRDSLRPDEWAVVLCLGLALSFASLGLRLLRPGPAWAAVLAAGLLLASASAFFALSQSFSSYSQEDAIVIVRNASVRSLPAESAQLSDMKLKPGEAVRVEERRMDWVRVRSGDAEGWLRASDVASLWRHSPSGD